MLKQPRSQVRLTNIAVVRIKKKGIRFEVACFKNKILNWRSGIETNIYEVLQTDAIFENVSKGKFASHENLTRCFGTTDTLCIARTILEKGDLQVSDKERDEAHEVLFKDIATIISKRVFNKKTGLPLSISMIETALASLGFSVVSTMSAKKQAIKGTILLLDKFPNEFARLQMLLQVSFQIQQLEIIKQFLQQFDIQLRIEEKKDCYIDKKTFESEKAMENLAPSGIAESGTFHCLPQFFGTIDKFFTVTLSPPANLVLLSSNERIINEENILQSTNNLNQSQSSNGSLNFPEPEIQSVSTRKPQKEDSSRKCRHCPNAVFESACQFRNHCKCDWHAFNVKRNFKNLDSVTQEEYDSLYQDIQNGFLAADC
ncbi:ribosome maturation protein SBDS-like [Hylaeus volcanicus]|uniref:ribosome maturation protein SBDS-like n=1 Tax=Hylaeus volcanicus TaxID=313075 RepID=UPI0023B77508|nr:ribosome maturation protein SBDS-like [Hylaeus volcanicus]